MRHRTFLFLAFCLALVSAESSAESWPMARDRIDWHSDEAECRLYFAQLADQPNQLADFIISIVGVQRDTGNVEENFADHSISWTLDDGEKKKNLTLGLRGSSGIPDVNHYQIQEGRLALVLSVDRVRKEALALISALNDNETSWSQLVEIHFDMPSEHDWLERHQVSGSMERWLAEAKLITYAQLSANDKVSLDDRLRKMSTRGNQIEPLIRAVADRQLARSQLDVVHHQRMMWHVNPGPHERRIFLKRIRSATTSQSVSHYRWRDEDLVLTLSIDEAKKEGWAVIQLHQSRAPGKHQLKTLIHIQFDMYFLASGPEEYSQ